MENVLFELGKVTDISYYLDTNKLKRDYLELLESHYGSAFSTTFEGEESRIYMNGNFEGLNQGRILVKETGDYFFGWYDFLENLTKQYISKEIYKNLDYAKNEIFIRYTIKEISYYLAQVEEFEIEKGLLNYKTFVIAKLEKLIRFLEYTYLDIIPNKQDNSPNTTSHKIQWLGKKNALATLFYELWKGQEKEDGKTTKKMIHVEQKDHLMDFIAQNFIDQEGNPFLKSSLSDQLSTSENKKSQRANKSKIIFSTP